MLPELSACHPFGISNAPQNETLIQYWTYYWVHLTNFRELHHCLFWSNIKIIIKLDVREWHNPIKFLETSIVLGLSNFSWLISWFFIAHLKWSCLLRGRLGDTKVETSQVLQGSMALHCHGDALWSPTGPTAVGLGWEMNPVHGQKKENCPKSQCIQVHHDSSWSIWSMIWVDWSWFIDGKSSAGGWWLWWIGHQTRSGPSNCRVRRVRRVGQEKLATGDSESKRSPIPALLTEDIYLIHPEPVLFPLLFKW